ncbi:MAG: hypothetical protein ACI4D0_05280 [Lachnospira sp.]
MIQQLKTEWDRMINGKLFWAALIVGCIISVFQIIMEVYPRATNVLRFYSGMNGEPYSLFMYWLGMNYASPYKVIYLTVLPILSMMPHALSYHMDIKSGYIKNVYTRTKKINYLFSKYIVTFIGGGIVIVIPYLLNLLISSCMLPALTPIPNGQYNSAADLFQELLYTRPLVYIAAYVVINFLYAGVFATTVLAATYVVDNIFLLSMVSFIIWYGLNIIQRCMVMRGVRFNMNPIAIVDMSQPLTLKMHYVVVTLLVTAIVSMVIYFVNGVKSDAI